MLLRRNDRGQYGDKPQMMVRAKAAQLLDMIEGGAAAVPESSRKSKRAEKQAEKERQLAEKAAMRESTGETPLALFQVVIEAAPYYKNWQKDNKVTDCRSQCHALGQLGAVCCGLLRCR
jgi:rare lipoprotein A (peptidoglycan hydrolase)